MDGQVIHRVSVRPSGVELEVRDGEDLFTAARRLGYRWPTVCGGKGTCRICFVRVEEGAENCSPVGLLEREGIESLRRPVDGSTRLACRLLVEGPVTVTKSGVRRRAQE
ncbi:2Fe-2S iron-sulfur cluster binding domain-containing protein [Streptomyces sp. 11x1]|uniref:2Fe-2S iron-sulfur cluster binding domain-containing protein n=1 Tax=Streptomyces sp. 11x1 TaxID=3038642 RepID=UPI002931BB6A|nr:2Fe-2S iron-sulfur cluster binding domain-containing protein [Streptomyces sp. 11x1]WNZ13411.1 2Fe-2S iron-sulfur cluster binding domain-containing protein [Streptomyces sp. 11x1]